MSPRIRVLIADDQALVRAGLRMILRASSRTSRSSARPPTATRRSRMPARPQPDVVLMDIRMPGAGRASRRPAGSSRDRATTPRVLILTTFDLDEYVYEALQAGASGFLLKDIPPEQLVDAIRVGRRRRRSCWRRRSPGG